MQELPDVEFSFKDFFTPFTPIKVIAIFTVVGLVVFGNMLFNGFVWDDNGYIVSNNSLHSLNLLWLFGPNLFNAVGLYRPITAVYFALLYNIFGLQPFFYHLLQLSLHIADSCLLLYLFRKFFNDKLSLFPCAIVSYPSYTSRIS